MSRRNPFHLNRASLRCALAAVLLGGWGSAFFAGCSNQDRPASAASSDATAGGAGKSSHANAGTSADEGGAATAAGGANREAEGGAALGGAPANSAGGSLPGPPGVAGDPGLTLDGCPTDDETKPPSLHGVCSATQAWAAGSDVDVASGDATSFVAITPSELTLLWSEVESSVPVYFLADRDAVDGAFGEAEELPFSKLLGISPDGLRLTLPTDDGGLLETMRVAPGESFGEPEQAAYATLDADAVQHHLALGDIAISPDDQTLYYVAWSRDGYSPYPLRVSSRSGTEAWPVGVALQACELKAYGAFAPQPLAVSADGLTLFYFDAARATARAAFRSTPSADFSWFVDLPERLRPQPNAACDRLYFSPMSDPGLLGAGRKP